MFLIAPRRRTTGASIAAVVPVSLFLLSASNSRADDYWNTSVTTGNWHLDANWSTGIPISTDTARITSTNTSETVTLNTNQSVFALAVGSSVSSGTTSALDVLNQSSNLSYDDASVGGDGDGNGRYSQSGGTSTVASYLVVGQFATTNGEYDISNSAVLNLTGAGVNNRALYVGDAGTGSLLQSGGTVSVGGTNPASVFLGYYGGGVGTYNTTGGSLTVSGQLDAGLSGNGTLVVGNTAAVTVNGGLEIAVNAGSTGTVTLNAGGTLTENNTEEHVGQSGNGTFNQNGGTHTVNQNLLIGVYGGSNGNYNLGGGTLNANSGYEFVGYSGNGTFTQTGNSTHTLTGQLVLGTTSGSVGTYTLYGGTASVGSAVVGGSGTGVLSLTGGTFTTTGAVSVGANGGINLTGNATVSMGTLNFQNPASVLQFTGDTLNLTGAGTDNLGASLSIGGPGLTATLNQQNGNVTVTGPETLGIGGTAAVSISGGTHTIGTPTANANLTIGSTSAATFVVFNAGSAVVNGNLLVGTTAAGSVGQVAVNTGGSVTVTGSTTLNSNANSTLSVLGGSFTTGTLDLEGQLTAPHFQFYGGTITLTGTGGGTNNLGQNFVVGQPTNPATTSTFNFNGGTLSLGTLYAGGQDVGVVNDTGGTITATQLYLGYFNGSNASTYSLGGTALLNTTYLSVGGNQAGAFNQTGGQHKVSGFLSLGNGSAPGTYNLSGGTLAVTPTSDEQIGYDSTGAFYQTGGTHTLGSASLPRNLDIGVGASGIYSMTNTTAVLTVNGNVNLGTSTSGATGQFNLSAGTATVTGSTAVYNASGNAINVSGGTFTTGSINTGGNPALFNWTGGTFAVTGSAGLTVGAGGPIGTIINLAGTKNLSVTNTLTDTGSISQGSGTLTAASVIVGAPGTTTGNFSQSAGALNVTGSFTNYGYTSLGGNQTYSPGATFTNAAGTTTFLTDAGSATASTLTINLTGGSIAFDSTQQHLAGLTITNGKTATVYNQTSGYVSILTVRSLAINGMLDIMSNAIDIQSGNTAPLASITALLKQGDANGTWAGTGGVGIVSSTAAANTMHNTAIGSLQNNQGGSVIYGTAAGQSLFDGIAPAANDVLVKYTYYGDANLDGKVDGSDYSLIDNSYNKEHAPGGTDITGWYNGDFNYDGKVDGSDYTLIDNAFNTQTTSLASSSLVAEATNQVATVCAVPEPAGALLFIAAAVCRKRLGPRKRS